MVVVVVRVCGGVEGVVITYINAAFVDISNIK